MFLETEQVKLRSMDVQDAEHLYLWSGDRDVTLFSLSSYAYPQSKTDIQRWLTDINSSRSTVTFGICCSKSSELIGYTGICDISQLNRCGEYFIFIGNKKYWHKGIGTEVTRLIVKYGFEVLGLHRIELTAYSENKGALKAYSNAGFVKEGVKRESGYVNGNFLDKVQMSILANEWLGS